MPDPSQEAATNPCDSDGPPPPPFVGPPESPTANWIAWFDEVQVKFGRTNVPCAFVGLATRVWYSATSTPRASLGTVWSCGFERCSPTELAAATLSPRAPIVTGTATAAKETRANTERRNLLTAPP